MPDNNAPLPTQRLNVVLCWHMHQPEYRDPVSAISNLPWTYLRTIKDYTDMAAHLEQVPNSRAVINFSPVLLKQIEDYTHQFNHYFTDNRIPNDPLLAALVEPAINSDHDYRYHLVEQCLKYHNYKSGQEFEQYVALTNIGRHILDNPGHLDYVCDAFFTDLIVWFHLTWLGETVRRDDPRAQALLSRARRYSIFERIQLVRIISEQITHIVPRYRALAADDCIELSMTPYAHPIGPLLLNLNSAEEASNHIPMPEGAQYPGGKERLDWHINAGKKLFLQHFGQAPIGCWPAEGALSEACITVLNDSGFLWTASGAGVLNNSLRDSHQAHNYRDSNGTLYRSYQLPNRDIRCFFRDDHLSDLIGFTYSSWHGDDAVANLIHRLENIAGLCAQQSLAEPVISIIMDGENAWEHYHQNGFFFIRELYRRLALHPDLNLTTFAQCIKGPSATLDRLTAGSWVHGNLTTWIGQADKNRAWDMLIKAKYCFDEVMQSHALTEQQRQAAELQLAICEGSDWFWWPGGENPPDSIASFDQLFRMHLKALYGTLGRTAPDYLDRPFTQAIPGDGTGADIPLGGVMRTSQ